MARPPSVIGVRELRTRLSAYLRRVAAGETLTIGDRRRRPMARLVPVERTADGDLLDRLARDGSVQRAVGKPRTRRRITLRGAGRTAADVVIEQRD